MAVESVVLDTVEMAWIGIYSLKQQAEDIYEY